MVKFEIEKNTLKCHQQPKNILKVDIGKYFHKNNIKKHSISSICMWKFYIDLVWAIIFIYVQTLMYIYICIHTCIEIHLCIQPNLKSLLCIHTDHCLRGYSKHKWMRPWVTALLSPALSMGLVQRPPEALSYWEGNQDLALLDMLFQ